MYTVWGATGLYIFGLLQMKMKYKHKWIPQNLQQDCPKRGNKASVNNLNALRFLCTCLIVLFFTGIVSGPVFIFMLLVTCQHLMTVNGQEPGTFFKISLMHSKQNTIPVKLCYNVCAIIS